MHLTLGCLQSQYIWLSCTILFRHMNTESQGIAYIDSDYWPISHCTFPATMLLMDCT